MSANGISHLSTKQAKQIAKLNFASLKRQGYTTNLDGTIASGPDSSKDFYRPRDFYDINKLPTKYNSNGLIDNTNSGGLSTGRPWVTQSYVFTINSSVNEGSGLNVGVALQYPYVPIGTTLYWTIHHITTSDADFTAVNGSFTLTNRTGSFTVTPISDALTEGAETFTIYLRTGSITGPVVAITSTETINDTSTTPAFYEQDLKAGTPITFVNYYNGLSLDVKSTNFDNTPAINGSYIKVNGTVIASDSTIGLGTLMTRGHTVAVLNPTTGAVISITTYDTYGGTTSSMQTALNALANGSLIVIATYDATQVDSGLRTVLQNRFGSTNPGTWTAERHSHIFIGFKR